MSHSPANGLASTSLAVGSTNLEPIIEPSTSQIESSKILHASHIPGQATSLPCQSASQNSSSGSTQAPWQAPANAAPHAVIKGLQKVGVQNKAEQTMLKEYYVMVDITKPLGLKIEMMKFPGNLKMGGICISSIDSDGQMASKTNQCQPRDRIIRVGRKEIGRKTTIEHFSSILSEMRAKPHDLDNKSGMVRLALMNTSCITTKRAKKPKKKPKKKEKTRRGTSAFQFFARERHAQIRNAQREITFGEISRIIAEEWNRLDDHAKTKYTEMYKKDRARNRAASKHIIRATAGPMSFQKFDSFEEWLIQRKQNWSVHRSKEWKGNSLDEKASMVYEDGSGSPPLQYFNTFDEWLCQRKSDWKKMRPETNSDIELAGSKKRGPTMHTIRIACSVVLNETIDTLMVLNEIIDSLATGSTYTPKHSKMKRNHLVGFQHFVIAETKRRQPDNMEVLSTLGTSLLTENDIHEIGLEWRNMDFQKQEEYARQSPGESHFIETWHGSRMYQKHERKQLGRDWHILHEWAALPQGIKSVWEQRGSVLVHLRNSYFSLAQNKYRKFKAKKKDIDKLKKEKEGKSGKKESHKESETPKPKRAMSAYMYFVKEQYSSMKASQPDLKFGDASKALGKQWKAMSIMSKAKFEALSATDKARYQRELKKTKKNVKMEGAKQRRPMGPFFVFCKEKRAENGPELMYCSVSEKSKVLGQLWNHMTPAEKSRYYTEEYKQYLADKRKVSGPRNPYEEYVYQMHRQDPNLKSDNTRSTASIEEELSTRWKALSKEMKETYRTPEYVAYRKAKSSGASMLILGRTTDEQLELLGNDRFALYALEKRVGTGAANDKRLGRAWRRMSLDEQRRAYPLPWDKHIEPRKDAEMLTSAADLGYRAVREVKSMSSKKLYAEFRRTYNPQPDHPMCDICGVPRDRRLPIPRFPSVLEMKSADLPEFKMYEMKCARPSHISGVSSREAEAKVTIEDLLRCLLQMDSLIGCFPVVAREYGGSTSDVPLLQKGDILWSIDGHVVYDPPSLEALLLSISAYDANAPTSMSICFIRLQGHDIRSSIKALGELAYRHECLMGISRSHAHHLDMCPVTAHEKMKIYDLLNTQSSGLSRIKDPDSAPNNMIEFWEDFTTRYFPSRKPSSVKYDYERLQQNRESSALDMQVESESNEKCIMLPQRHLFFNTFDLSAGVENIFLLTNYIRSGHRNPTVGVMMLLLLDPDSVSEFGSGEAMVCPGDYILSIDEKCVAGCSIVEVLQCLNSASNPSSVRVQFRREGKRKPYSFSEVSGVVSQPLLTVVNCMSSLSNSERIRESNYYGVRWVDMPGDCQWLATLALELENVESESGGSNSTLHASSSSCSSGVSDDVDNYGILGLEQNSTEDEVKKAYHRLSLKFHPDKNIDRPEEAAAQFQRIAKAYSEILKSPPSRLTIVLGFYSSEKLAAQVCDAAARMQWGNASIPLLNFSARTKEGLAKMKKSIKETFHWAQCEECEKWRVLPRAWKREVFTCQLGARSCSDPEDTQDSAKSILESIRIQNAQNRSRDLSSSSSRSMSVNRGEKRLKSDKAICKALDWLERVYKSSVRADRKHYLESDMDKGQAALHFEELIQEADKHPPYFPEGLEIVNEHLKECNAALNEEKESIANSFAQAIDAISYPNDSEVVESQPSLLSTSAFTSASSPIAMCSPTTFDLPLDMFPVYGFRRGIMLIEDKFRCGPMAALVMRGYIHLAREEADRLYSSSLETTEVTSEWLRGIFLAEDCEKDRYLFCYDGARRRMNQVKGGKAVYKYRTHTMQSGRYLYDASDTIRYPNGLVNTQPSSSALAPYTASWGKPKQLRQRNAPKSTNRNLFCSQDYPAGTLLTVNFGRDYNTEGFVQLVCVPNHLRDDHGTAHGGGRRYGQEIVGAEISMYWPIDQKWYSAKIESHDHVGRHKIVYHDGMSEWCYLHQQNFKFHDKGMAKKSMYGPDEKPIYGEPGYHTTSSSSDAAKGTDLKELRSKLQRVVSHLCELEWELPVAGAQNYQNILNTVDKKAVARLDPVATTVSYNPFYHPISKVKIGSDGVSRKPTRVQAAESAVAEAVKTMESMLSGPRKKKRGGWRNAKKKKRYFELPAYFSVCVRSTCLSNISRRLRGVKYHNVESFLADIHLIVDNATTYYSDPENRIHCAAKDLMAECMSALDNMEKFKALPTKVPEDRQKPNKRNGAQKQDDNTANKRHRTGGRVRATVERFNPASGNKETFFSGKS